MSARGIGRVAIGMAIAVNVAVAGILAFRLAAAPERTDRAQAPFMPGVLMGTRGSGGMLNSERLKRAVEALEVELASGNLDGPGSPLVGGFETFRTWMGKRVDGSSFQLFLTTTHAETTAGAIVDLTAELDTWPHELVRMYLSFGPERARLHDTYPRSMLADMRTQRVQVNARVEPARAWMSADVTTEIVANGSRTVFLDFMAIRMPRLNTAGADYDRGVRLVEVSQDGEPCKFGPLEDRTLLVHLHRPADRVTLRMRYEGAPYGPYDDYIDDAGVHLRRWLPIVPGSAPEMAITLRTPTESGVFGLGEADRQSGADGWTERRWQLPAGSSRPMLLVTQAPLATPRTVETRGVTATIYGDLDGSLDDDVAGALAGLSELDPPASQSVDVVLTSRNRAASGAVFVNAASSLPVPMRPAWRRFNIAAAFALRWLERAVTVESGRPPWTHAVSWYLAHNALAETDAAALRRWLADFERSESLALLRTPRVNDRDWFEFVAKVQGCRLLIGLAERIGKDQVWAAVRRVVDNASERASDWEQLIAAVEHVSGPRHAAWLRDWLALEYMAGFVLAVVATERDAVIVRVSRTAPLPPVAVPIAVFRGDELVRVETVEMVESQRDVRLELSPGAYRLVLDPDHRVPRRLSDEAGKPIDAELSVSLGERTGKR